MQRAKNTTPKLINQNNMMLQLNPTISVKTPKGDAEALIIIDYGINVNSVWLCRMKGGKVLHFYSDDILIYDNPMNGNGWDVDDNSKLKKFESFCDDCNKFIPKESEIVKVDNQYICFECYSKRLSK